jgi:hypothetical protein
LRKLSNKTRVIVLASLTLLIALTIPVINAQTVTITVDPGDLMPGEPVEVEGTGFAATTAVGIGAGEVTVEAEAHQITNLVTDPIYDEERNLTMYGPFGGTTDHTPIKPGSAYVFYDVDGITSEYFDDYANGTLNTTSTYAIDPFINYVTGEFGRYSSADWSGFSDPWVYITYTYYQNMTPAGGVTTDSSGEFTASTEVSADIVNGEYSVTAVDEKGNFATSTETFEKIPEGLTFGVMMLVSSVAVLVGYRYLWNRSRKREK